MHLRTAAIGLMVMMAAACGTEKAASTSAVGVSASAVNQVDVVKGLRIPIERTGLYTWTSPPVSDAALGSSPLSASGVGWRVEGFADISDVRMVPSEQNGAVQVQLSFTVTSFDPPATLVILRAGVQSGG